MTARSLHRVIGITMLLPFVAWAVTGTIFFLKPGYGSAYEALAVKTYPIEAPVTLPPQPTWLDIRYVRTVAGEHLLVRTDKGREHLDPRTLQPKQPTEQDVRALVSDAFTANPSRYGRIVSVDGSTVTTDTGVRVTLDWSRLSLSQRGHDTDLIDRIYKVHYLQWTGVDSVDKILGGAGLVLIVLLSGLGVKLLLRRT